VRAVVQAAGIKDILTKSLGSANVLNVARATLEGLMQLVDPEELAELRGRSMSEMVPFWHRQDS
jgi:small subunit ribosomal protein S5